MSNKPSRRNPGGVQWRQSMMVPKGYRAREAAALERSNRQLVSDEIRAQRAAILLAKEAALQGAEPEKPVAADPVVPSSEPEGAAEDLRQPAEQPEVQEPTEPKHGKGKRGPK